MVLASICIKVSKTIPTLTALSDPLSSKENRRGSIAGLVVSSYLDYHDFNYCLFFLVSIFSTIVILIK